MYIYTPLCRYWIALYRYVLVFIVPHVDIELEDNKQFISNIPRISFFHNFGTIDKKINQKKVLKNIQFGNIVWFGDNRLWDSYREQLIRLTRGLISLGYDNHVDNNLKEILVYV